MSASVWSQIINEMAAQTLVLNMDRCTKNYCEPAKRIFVFIFRGYCCHSNVVCRVRLRRMLIVRLAGQQTMLM